MVLLYSALLRRRASTGPGIAGVLPRLVRAHGLHPVDHLLAGVRRAAAACGFGGISLAVSLSST